MGLQTYFSKFHENIKLNPSTKKELREKRDILIGILRDSRKLPSFEEFSQGSYGMFLGIKPIDDEEYDIDVGLRFNVNKDDYGPLEIKETIREILKGHTDYGTKIRKPCVTVTYKKDGEKSYHVDLVTYSYEDKDDHNSQMYLAKGTESSPEEVFWEKADPVALLDYIQDTVQDDTKREQFRRIVKYIKHWKKRKFSSSGHAEPPSIGINENEYPVIEKELESTVTKRNTGESLDEINLILEDTYLIELKQLPKNKRQLFTIKVSRNEGSVNGRHFSQKFIEATFNAVRSIRGRPAVNVFATTNPMNTLHISKRVFVTGNRANIDHLYVYQQRHDGIRRFSAKAHKIY